MPKKSGLMSELFGGIISVVVIIAVMLAVWQGYLSDAVANITAEGGFGVLAGTLIPLFYFLALAIAPILILYAVMKHVGFL